MKNIRTIIKKEWAEVFKRRVVVLIMLLVPLLFTLIPLVMLGVMSNTSVGVGADVSPEMLAQSGSLPGDMEAVCVGLSGNDCMQVMMVIQFLLMFMMMPLLLPITIAAYSIVGEKTTRSLEPLLATPITTLELLVGKCSPRSFPRLVPLWHRLLCLI